MVKLKLGAFDLNMDLGDNDDPRYHAALMEWCAERARAQESLDRALALVLDAASEYRLVYGSGGSEDRWGRSLDSAIDQVLDAVSGSVLSHYDALRAV